MKEESIDNNNLTIEACAKVLLNYRKCGKKVYTFYKGVRLDSSRIESIDDAYLIVYDEYKKNSNSKNRYTDECRNKVPKWIERGKKLISHPEKMAGWEEEIINRAVELEGSYNHANEIRSILDIMEALENGLDLDEVKDMYEVAACRPYNVGISGWDRDFVRLVVLKFSKKGPDFYDETAFRHFGFYPISEYERERINKQIKENARLDGLQNGDSTNGASNKEQEKIAIPIYYEEDVASKEEKSDGDIKDVLVATDREDVANKEDVPATTDKELEQANEIEAAREEKESLLRQIAELKKEVERL